MTLTEIEQGEARAFRTQGFNASGIATELSRSRCVLYNFFMNHKEYNNKKTGGPKCKLTVYDE